MAEEANARDVAYFRERPTAEWRVREVAAGEWDGLVAPGTHVVIVYDRLRDRYYGGPFTPEPGVDPYDAAVVALVENPPPCWRVA